jgi:hypothetical protein
MRHSKLLVFVISGILGACSKPAPTPEVPPPATPSGEAPAPAMPPATEDTPRPPQESSAAPAQPAPEAPPPTEPSPTPKPTSSSGEPALESMQLARTSAKIGVPVDLHYSFDGEVRANQPAQLYLAAVPRVAGTDLRISVQQAAGLDFSKGALTVRKVAQAGVYRKHLAVTRQASGPGEIRVLVTMGIGEGSGHGFYSIPLDSVKQR